MAHDLLGEVFDIHGGGNDLMFPHHENEIAQSRCAGHDFARVWMHNEMLQVEGRKMSKSLGNFFTVRDLLNQGVPGEVIRFVMLSTHYRKPMDWTADKAREAQATLERWGALTAGVEPAQSAAPDVLAALADDLNTPGAIAALHRLARAGDGPGLASGMALMGLEGLEARQAEVAPDVADLLDRLLTARADARTAKDWARADQLRDGFAAAGVTVRDTADGASWELADNFDPAKLEGLV